MKKLMGYFVFVVLIVVLSLSLTNFISDYLKIGFIEDSERFYLSPYFNDSSVLRYSFSNGTFLDGEKLDEGLVVNSVSWTKDGKFGGGLIFDNVKDYFGLEGPIKSLKDNNIRGISFWVEFNERKGRYVFSDKMELFNLEINNSFNVITSYMNIRNEKFKVDEKLIPGVWYNFAIVFGKNNVVFYIDNVFMGKVFLNNSYEIFDNGWLIGANGESDGFVGKIDEIIIFGEVENRL